MSTFEHEAHQGFSVPFGLPERQALQGVTQKPGGTDEQGVHHVLVERGREHLIGQPRAVVAKQATEAIRATSPVTDGQFMDQPILIAAHLGDNDTHAGGNPAVQNTEPGQPGDIPDAGYGGRDGNEPPLRGSETGDEEPRSFYELLKAQGVPPDILEKLLPTGIANEYVKNLTEVFMISNSQYETPEQLDELREELGTAIHTLPTYSDYCYRNFYAPAVLHRPEDENTNIFYALTLLPNALALDGIAQTYQAMGQLDILTDPAAREYISELYFQATGAAYGEEQEMLLRKRQADEKQAVSELHEGLEAKIAQTMARVKESSETETSEPQEPDPFAKARTKLTRFIGSSRPGSLIFDAAKTALALAETEGYIAYYRDEYSRHRKATKGNRDLTISEEFQHISRKAVYQRQVLDSLVNPRKRGKNLETPFSKAAHLFTQQVLRSYRNIASQIVPEEREMQLLIAAKAAFEDVTAIEQQVTSPLEVKRLYPEVRALLAAVATEVDLSDIRSLADNDASARKENEITRPELPEPTSAKELTGSIYQTAVAALLNEPSYASRYGMWTRDGETIRASRNFSREFKFFEVTHKNGQEGIYSVSLEAADRRNFTRGTEEEAMFKTRAYDFAYSLDSGEPLPEQPDSLAIRITNHVPGYDDETYTLKNHNGKLKIRSWKNGQYHFVTNSMRKRVLEIVQQLQYAFQLSMLE